MYRKIHYYSLSDRGKVVETDHQNIKAHSLNLTTIKPCQSVPDGWKKTFSTFLDLKAHGCAKKLIQRGKITKKWKRKKQVFPTISKNKKQRILFEYINSYTGKTNKNKGKKEKMYDYTEKSIEKGKTPKKQEKDV